MVGLFSHLFIILFCLFPFLFPLINLHFIFIKTYLDLFFCVIGGHFLHCLQGILKNGMRTQVGIGHFIKTNHVFSLILNFFKIKLTNDHFNIENFKKNILIWRSPYDVTISNNNNNNNVLSHQVMQQMNVSNVLSLV